MNFNGHTCHSAIALCQATLQRSETRPFRSCPLEAFLSFGVEPGHHDCLQMTWCVSLSGVGGSLPGAMRPHSALETFLCVPALLFLLLNLPPPANCCWRHDLFSCRRRWGCLTPMSNRFPYSSPLLSAARSLGFRFPFPR